jgi:serine/threonine-protein kinase RsbW
MDAPSKLETTIGLNLPASYDYLQLIGPCIRALLEPVEQRERETAAYNSELALYELCTNIVDHAYAGASGRIQLQFAFQQAPPSLLITIHDTGRPLEQPPQAPQLPEPEQSQGYGLFLIYQLMDEVIYHTDESGNHWQLIKRF